MRRLLSLLLVVSVVVTTGCASAPKQVVKSGTVSDVTSEWISEKCLTEDYNNAQFCAVFDNCNRVGSSNKICECTSKTNGNKAKGLLNDDGNVICGATSEGQLVWNKPGSSGVSATDILVGALIVGATAALLNDAASRGGYYVPPPSPAKTYDGNCYYESDIAADGSRCGKRAATARPGGVE